jgi:hypothetical protein
VSTKRGHAIITLPVKLFLLHLMIILQRLPADMPADSNDRKLGTGDSSRRIKAFDIIRNAAEQVICYIEDFVLVPKRSNLWRTRSVPESAKTLSNLVHNSEVTVRLQLRLPEQDANLIQKRDVLRNLADEKGFIIEFNTEESFVLWLQGGGLSSQPDRITLFTFIRRPKGAATAIDEEQLDEEPLFEGIIARPIANGLWVQSSFACRLGEILILEGSEKVILPTDDARYRDICMLTNLHRTIPKRT